MTLSQFVTVTITRDTVGASRAGFGTPLLLSAYASFAERTRTYESLAEVAEDFAVTTSPEYLAAQQLFSQSPRPAQIKIGRSALKPTQVYRINVTTVRNSHTYTINVKGKGVTSTAVTFTSDASATNDEIIAGLVAALNLVTGNNYLAAAVDSGTSDYATVTGDAAGDWFSLEVDPADLEVLQTHADPGVATDLANIALEDDDWYALITFYNSNAYVLAAAAWIETQKKIYYCDLDETKTITQAVTGSDTADDLHTLAYARTAVWYHPSSAAMLGASIAGRCLPIDPGGETHALKNLSGVAAVTMTSTHRTNLLAKEANSYRTVGGSGRTFDGTTADGDYIDVTRGLDWLENDMQVGVFNALASADKIPFTDAGVAVVENEVRASLARAVVAGVLSDDPKPVVTVPRVANIASADKAARNLPDVSWSATLAGAIHKVNIAGTVSV